MADAAVLLIDAISGCCWIMSCLTNLDCASRLRCPVAWAWRRVGRASLLLTQASVIGSP
jgi:hypothetical protein